VESTPHHQLTSVTNACYTVLGGGANYWKTRESDRRSTVRLPEDRLVSFKIRTSCFLADRTNGRAYATALRLSIVCNVMYCG